MAKKGRPPKVDIKKLIGDVDGYIKKANPPILAEFAHKHGITRQYLYELAETEAHKGHRELSDAIKRISEAKEITLEKKALNGEYAQNIAIFSLKQLGWKDKAEQEVNLAVLNHAAEILGGIESVIDD